MLRKNCALLMLKILLIVFSVVLANITCAFAGEGGGSHYGPGFYGDFGVSIAPDPGFYLRNDFYYYTADGGGDRFTEFGDIRADLEVDAAMIMLTGLLVTDREILGGRYACGAVLPVVYTDISADIIVEDAAGEIDDDRTAIADPAFIPFSLFWNHGNFHFNLYETVTLPIGSYDKNRNVDSGLNYWSFDTSFGFTYLHPEKGCEVSTTLGYIYNTENDDTDYHTGQEFYAEYMLNQFLSETFALGVQGFYYKQITGDSGSGALLGDFKGEAAGVGPALMWGTKILNTNVTMSAKWLHEFHTEHRMEGDHIYASATLAF